MISTTTVGQLIKDSAHKLANGRANVTAPMVGHVMVAMVAMVAMVILKPPHVLVSVRVNRAKIRGQLRCWNTTAVIGHSNFS